MTRMLSLLMALAICAPTIASAKPNLQFGKLELHPYYKLAETYDSNIYMVPKDLEGVQVGGGVRSAWITENNLGIDFNLPISAIHKVKAGYDFQALNYSRQPKANNAINQKVNVGYHYASGAYKANVMDAYINTEDPAFSESATRERRWNNKFGLGGEYSPEGGNMFVGVSFDHVTDKYINRDMGAMLNRFTQTYGVKGGYKLQPKTRVFMGYRREIIHYTVKGDNRPNNKTHYMDFGIEGDIAPKLKGNITTGLGIRHYDNDGGTYRDANLNTLTESRTKTTTRNWTLGTNLSYKPIERGLLNLTWTRGYNEATSGRSAFYISNNFMLGYQHKLPMKLTAMADFSMGIDKYSEALTAGGKTQSRRDDIYQQKLGLDYEANDWATVGLSYLHRQKFSIFSGQYNYNDHQTSLFAKVRF